MKKLLLSVAILTTTVGIAQTTLYTEDFETGPGSFTLNTADVSSTSGTGGTNYWIVNNNYTGGSGSVICLGFPFTYTITNTASQPVGINNGPNSSYLHMISNTANANSIFCSSYQAADGVCTLGETNFSAMSGPINTVGYTNVTMDFWWICGGATGTIYGEVYYSLDAGATWTLLTSPLSQYANQQTWTQTSITDPIFDNQAQLQFGFRFVNSTSGTAAEPGFSIDDIEITGTAASSNTITTNNTISPTGWCVGSSQSLTVDFVSTGTFNAGNVYTAEISDAAGSFAAPSAIGTLASSAAGAQSISATVPGSLTVGTGYRIRVVASDPATTGTDNTTDLQVYDLPTVSLGNFSDMCGNDPAISLLGGTPGGGTYSGPGVTANDFYPAVAGTGTHTITYTYVDGNGCSNDATATLFVDTIPTVTLDPFSAVCVDDASFTLGGGLPAGGVYTIDAAIATSFDPSIQGIGSFTIGYEVLGANGCSNTATEAIAVDECASVEELALNLNLYPNPTNNYFIIEADFNVQGVIIYDLKGSVVRRFENEDQYSIQGLTEGLYKVHVQGSTGETVVNLRVQ